MFGKTLLTVNVLAIVLGAVLMSPTQQSMAANNGTTQRSIEDWLVAQGQGYGYAQGFPADYLAFTGRDPGNPNAEIDKLIVLDYAGIDADEAGVESPEISGSVTERTLKDGRTEVHVRLQVRCALTYVLDFSSGDVIFGADPEAVAQGAEPGLGMASMEVVYIVDRPRGAEMEDLMQVIFDPFEGDELAFIAFHGVAFGPLADGSAGMASTAQTAPIAAAVRNGFKGGLSDGFPVEMIRVQKVGD